MFIVNFFLFCFCCFSAIGFLISCLLLAPWASFIFAVLFIFGYWLIRFDTERETKPKEIILTYRNGDLNHGVEYNGVNTNTDDFDFFDFRNNLNFN